MEVTTQVNQEQKKKYQEKFQKVLKIQNEILAETDESRQKLLKYKYLSLCEDDVFSFAFINLKDKKGFPYKLYDYQDLIANDKSKRILVAKGRKIGATDVISIRLLHKAIYNKNWELVVASKTQDMAKRIIERIRGFIRNVPVYYDYNDVFGGLDNKFELSIKHDKGKANSKIISVVAGDSARGIDPDELWVDEAAFIGEGPQKNADYIFREILAPSVTFKNAVIGLVSTPPKQPIGFFYESYKSKYWAKYHFPSFICPVITPEILEQWKDEMTYDAYRREILGEFFASNVTYFSHQEINDAIDTGIEIPLYTEQTEYIGVDWGETLSNSARVHVICDREIDKENLKTKVNVKVINIKEYPLKTDYAFIIKELENIKNRRNGNIRILADAGVGRGQISVMKDMGMPVEEYSFGGTKKGDLFTELKILFEKRRIKIPDHKQLINELSVYQAEYNPITQRTKYHQPKDSKISEHILDALALACFAAVRFSKPASLSIVTQKTIH